MACLDDGNGVQQTNFIDGECSVVNVESSQSTGDYLLNKKTLFFFLFFFILFFMRKNEQTIGTSVAMGNLIFQFLFVKLLRVF